MKASYTIGLDYGTNSVRALIVNTATGEEIATAIWNYAHGTHGVLLSRDPNLARQHPADYLAGAGATIKRALQAARRAVKGFEPSHVKGIGVDTTGSTPLPVDATGQARALYHQLYRLYRNLHDAFGTRQANGSLHEVMKELIRLRNQARK